MRAVVAGLFGAVTGSFLNVVIWRVPRGESIVAPGSRCPSCGHALAPYDNVPIISWFVLRGRCRHCRAPISARYVIVEIVNAGLWFGAALRFGSTERAALVALTASVLLALSLIDLEHLRLPNSIVLPGIVGAVVWVGAVSVASGELNVATTAVVCGAAAFTLFFIIAVVSRGMGFGDVKLAAFIGVVSGRFGWEVTFAAILGSFFVGGLVGVFLLAVRRRGRKQTMPFGPAMAAGAVLAIFVGPSPVRAWLGL